MYDTLMYVYYVHLSHLQNIYWNFRIQFSLIERNTHFAMYIADLNCHPVKYEVHCIINHLQHLSYNMGIIFYPHTVLVLTFVLWKYYAWLWNIFPYCTMTRANEYKVMYMYNILYCTYRHWVAVLHVQTYMWHASTLTPNNAHLDLMQTTNQYSVLK